MGRTLLPRAYRELLGVTALVTAADIDWTIIRFIRPTDGTPTGTVRAGFFGTDRIGFAITRADIAAFTRGTGVRQAVRRTPPPSATDATHRSPLVHQEDIAHA